MGKYSITKLPSDILASTAQKVSVLRKELGWTQQELAHRSGVSYGSIKRFERSGQISFESLLKVVESVGRLSEFEKLLISKNDERLRKLFNSDK
jgi:transcriptional regulator with XRE-family HTH domain